jgi:hypothetical protein
MGTMGNPGIDPAKRGERRGSDDPYPYYYGEEPAYAGMEERMAECRDALTHRVLWLLLRARERASWGAPGADEQAAALSVDTVASLLHCRKESAMRAVLWLNAAGIVRLHRPAASSGCIDRNQCMNWLST